MSRFSEKGLIGTKPFGKGILVKLDASSTWLADFDLAFLIRDLQFGVKNGIDMVFASYMRSASDVLAVRAGLGVDGINVKVGSSFVPSLLRTS